MYTKKQIANVRKMAIKAQKNEEMHVRKMFKVLKNQYGVIGYRTAAYYFYLKDNV